MKEYLMQVWTAVSQLVNALTGGWSDESFSARAYRLRDRWLWDMVRRTINAILFWDEDHCRKAYESEMNGSQRPGEYR